MHDCIVQPELDRSSLEHDGFIGLAGEQTIHLHRIKGRGREGGRKGGRYMRGRERERKARREGGREGGLR